MVKHIVLFKLQEIAEGATKEENAKKIKSQLEALSAKIPQIRRLEVGINAVPSDAAYDVALYTEFSDKADLEIYQKHPEHMKVAGLVKTVAASRAVVDYIL